MYFPTNPNKSQHVLYFLVHFILILWLFPIFIAHFHKRVTMAIWSPVLDIQPLRCPGQREATGHAPWRIEHLYPSLSIYIHQCFWGVFNCLTLEKPRFHGFWVV